LVIYLALGGHTSGTSTAANIIGIPDFIFLFIIVFKVVPSGLKRAKRLLRR